MLKMDWRVSANYKFVGKDSTYVIMFEKDVQHIEKVIQKGVSKIVVKKEWYNQKDEELCNISGVKYELYEQEPYLALAEYSMATLEHPKYLKKLKLIGITGTNGKTSTTFMIEHLLRKLGKKVALMGGVDSMILGKSIGISPHNKSSPQPDYIHVFLSKCSELGVEYVVFEVSSPGIDYRKVVHGLEFDAIGFTNFTQDHLDYFGTMEKYFQSKMILCSHTKPNGVAVVNLDDEWLQKSLSYLKVEVIQLIKEKFLEEFVQYSEDVNHALFGEHNVSNAMLAFLICQYFDKERLKPEMLNDFKGVPGRLQKHILKNKAIGFVDYAHNPDGLEKVLGTLRTKTKHLVVIFGCGGNKDRTKRKIMGAAVSKCADEIIITNDNPRSEDPNEIAKDILEGVNQKYRIEHGRKLAIKYGASITKEGSFLVICGKGHEETIEINGKMIFHSDYEELVKY
jgi:UDP-N-acetylmuramoyl-L-alanyl-D-glutamate--2,6-diaminopimelate ligase